METGHLYNGRLNELKWKGCYELWKHRGLDGRRRVPAGFHTLGVPGILASQSIEGDLNLDTNRLDDLVRGYVGERWAAHGPEQEHDPLYILDINHDLKVLKIAVEGEVVWMYDDPNYGWVGFSEMLAAADWIKNSS